MQVTAKQVGLWAAGVLGVTLVLVLGWRMLPSGGNDVPTDSISVAVHESLTNYQAELAVSFIAAADKVDKGELKTDAELQDWLSKQTAAGRAHAFSPLDTLIQSDLPRDENKLKSDAGAFLKAIGVAISNEGESK